MISRSPRLPRTARRLVAVVSTAALVVTLAACGDDAPPANTDPTGVDAGAGLDSLTVNGKLGQEPKLSWQDSVTVDATETETVIEGSGEKVQEGDSVLAHLLVANGVDQQVTTSDFASSPQLLTLGGQLLPAIKDALVGARPGSRVVVAAPPKDAFGEQGNPQLGIGNQDTVVFVIDLETVVHTEPHGTRQKAPAWAPTVEETGGAPSSFDFTGTPPPSKDLEVATLVEGDGEKVTTGDSVYVNYLGQVYGAKQPFDSSYEKGQPYSIQLGVSNEVKGWHQGIDGLTVGSRVILSIPPELGYGKKGNPGAKIKGTDTMYFLVDVLAKA